MWADRGGLTRVGFLGEATWEEARGGRARRATITALPAALHRPRPYGLASTFPTNLPVQDRGGGVGLFYTWRGSACCARWAGCGFWGSGCVQVIDGSPDALDHVGKKQNHACATD